MQTKFSASQTLVSSFTYNGPRENFLARLNGDGCLGRSVSEAAWEFLGRSVLDPATDRYGFSNPRRTDRGIQVTVHWSWCLPTGQRESADLVVLVPSKGKPECLGHAGEVYKSAEPQAIPATPAPASAPVADSRALEAPVAPAPAQSNGAAYPQHLSFESPAGAAGVDGAAIRDTAPEA